MKIYRYNVKSTLWARKRFAKNRARSDPIGIPIT